MLNRTRRISPSTAARAILVGCLSLLLVTCSGPKAWQRVDTESGFGDIWNGFVQIAEQSGFRADVAATDRGRREYRSKWRVQSGGFNNAERARLHARFERLDGTASTEVATAQWRIEFYVEREVVTEMRRRGFEPEERDWSSGGQDGLREEVLLGQHRVRFGQELGIDPKYRRSR